MLAFAMGTYAPNPLQFGLRGLFALTAVIATLVAAWLSGGLLAALAWLPVIMLLAMLAVELLSILVGSLYKRLLDPW